MLWDRDILIELERVCWIYYFLFASYILLSCLCLTAAGLRRSPEVKDYLRRGTLEVSRDICYILYDTCYTLYTMYYTLHTIHYMIHAIHYTLCTIHYLLYTI